MTAFTTNFALPYPTGGDEPCLFNEQWCAFTSAVQTVLDGFTQSANRTNPTVPVAQVRITTPVSVLASDGEQATAPFDAEIADTASWVNFDTDNTVITVNRAGQMVFTGTAQTASPSGDSTLNAIRARIDLSTSENRFLDTGTGVDTGGSIAGIYSNSDVTEFALTVTQNLTTQTDVDFEGASLTVFWIADGPRT